MSFRLTTTYCLPFVWTEKLWSFYKLEVLDLALLLLQWVQEYVNYFRKRHWSQGEARTYWNITCTTSPSRLGFLFPASDPLFQISVSKRSFNQMVVYCLCTQQFGIDSLEIYPHSSLRHWPLLHVVTTLSSTWTRPARRREESNARKSWLVLHARHLLWVNCTQRTQLWKLRSTSPRTPE